MEKTALEILNADVKPDERHAWLSDATASEIYEFLRWVKADSSWALHGRDALNVVLARENLKLQKDIRDMTKQLHRLTIFIAILALIQIYPIYKTILGDAKILFNSPKRETTMNQGTNTNQIKDKKNQILMGIFF
jgi:hypothetical protein